MGMILGIDEVGRGPWAGPLVVGAVILGTTEIDGLNDSKKLTKKRREVLDVEIREKAAAWALGWVSAQELDEGGMSAALRLATRRAVEQIQVQCREKSVTFDEIIIDGTVNFLADTALGRYVTVMARADGLVPSVSAASIIAKVTRDAYMCEQDDVYPGYGFAGNAGYGVAKHRAAIEKLGVCPEHRLSFAPLQKYSTAGLLPSSEAPLAKYVAERESDGDSSVEEAVTGVKPRQPNATGAQPRKEYSEADESLARTSSGPASSDLHAVGDGDDGSGENKTNLINLLYYHLDLFDKWQPHLGRPYETLKRFFKIYIRDFDGAKDLRDQLMHTKTTLEARALLQQHKTKDARD